MNLNQVNLIPPEELIHFFRCKKTEISCGLDDPRLFLNTLRDHDLVSEDLYQKVIKMKSKERSRNGVYKILECLEKEPAEKIKRFWSCLFMEHIMQKYSFLRSLQTSLQGYYLLAGKLSRSEQLTGIDEKQAEQKKSGAKRKKSVDETEEEDAHPSSVSSSSQKKPMIILDDSSEEFEELSEKEDRNQAEEEEKETDESSEDIEDLSETEDMSKFEAADLPVSCGSVTGVLHKRRFAGPHSKSIRTKRCWFTPVEFAKQAFTQTDGHWKKDILCHGKTLEYLVKMKILDFHPQGCRCQVCCPKSPMDHDKDDLCFICNDGEKLVFCSMCPRAFHHLCHLPTLQDKPLGSYWICTFCMLKANLGQWIHMTKEGALSSPFSSNIMRCEYLLLFLYKEDTQRMFRRNPSTTEERYSSVISKPMWMDKVKLKLKKNKYTTVGEFVQDINLIFDNYQTFYKDNAGKMGDKMKKIFEKMFDTVFKIQ